MKVENTWINNKHYSLHYDKKIDIEIPPLLFKNVLCKLDESTNRYAPIKHEEILIRKLINLYQTNSVLFLLIPLKSEKRVIDRPLRYSINNHLKKYKLPLIDLAAEVKAFKGGDFDSLLNCLTEPRSELEQKKSLLNKMGFRLVKNFFEKHHARISYDFVADDSTSLDRLESVIEMELNKPIPSPNQAEKRLKTKKSKTENEHPYLDAMQFRVAGSFGSGKKR